MTAGHENSPRDNSPLLSVSEYDYIAKILLVGESGVGKTSMVLKFADNTFDQCFISTIGVDFRFLPLKVQVQGVEKVVKLQIWDTAGQERFRAVTRSFYRGAHGVMLCFDLTDRISFLKIKDWLKDVSHFMDIENGTVILVGTKSDLVDHRQVDYEVAKKYAESIGCSYIETSSKSGSGIKEAFSLTATQTTMKIIERGIQTKVTPMLPEKTNSCCTII